MGRGCRLPALRSAAGWAAMVLALAHTVAGWLFTSSAGATGSESSWEVVLPQHENRDYLKTRPRTRYSHTATELGSDVFIVFGYYYDHWDKGGPTWHPDVWALSTKPAVAEDKRWRIVSDVRNRKGPQPRMNHVTIVAPFGGKNAKLVVFGGSGVKDVKFNDLWEMDVKTGAWTERLPRTPPPSARNCFSGVLVGSNLLVYGGFHLGDLWGYSFEGNRWDLLMDSPAQDHAGHPGKRAGHGCVSDSKGEGMYVYGGFRFQDDVTDHNLGWGKLPDMWYYNAVENTWRLLPQVSGTQGGRQFFSMSLVPWWRFDTEEAEASGQGLAIFGGTQCVPKCNLVGSLSVFSLDDNRWYKINVEEPLHRYHHTHAYSSEAIWIHGGESFAPHMYHNSISRIAWPPPRSVAEELPSMDEKKQSEL